MGYVEAKNLKQAKKKVVLANKRYRLFTGKGRKIVYVKSTRRKGIYIYQTQPRKLRKDAFKKSIRR